MKRLTFLSALIVTLFSSCTSEPFATTYEQMGDHCTLTQTRTIAENTIDYSIYERYEPKCEPITIDLPDGNRVYLDPIDSVYFSGDMIFSKEFIESISTNVRSAVTSTTSLYWPNKVIKYTTTDMISAQERQVIEAALNDISNATHLTFIYDNSVPHVNKLVYTHSSETNVSFSPIGRQSGRYNNIRLASGGFSKGTVIHETLHSLGFFHEHNRTDRDNYVTIYEENIDPTYLYAFDTFVDRGFEGYNRGAFDFSSIMLYGSFSFSINNNATMRKKDGSLFSAQRAGLSNGDIAGLNYIYGYKPILTTSIVSYEDNGDFSSRDETTIYSNIITFVDKNNNPVTLSYPRLLWIHFSSEETDHSGETTSNNTTTQVVIPAGTSSYSLGNTQDIWQADMGIDRYRYRSTYGVTYY